MSIQSQLYGMDIRKLKTSNGKTLAECLYSEVIRLKNLIQFYLDEYLMSTPPMVYKRTGMLLSSLQIDDFLSIQIVNGGLEIAIRFNDNAIHTSGDGIIGWDGSDEKVNVAVLLNYGYRVKKDVWFKNIENFGYRTGVYFVEDGVADFNQSNPYGIKVTIIRPDSYLV